MEHLPRQMFQGDISGRGFNDIITKSEEERH
jgi:hypothetical protein